MERLRGVDFRAAIAFQQEIYAFADVAPLKSRLMTALPAVIPAESIMYLESDLRTKRSTGPVDPPDALTPERLKIYGQFVGESPLLKAYTRGKGSAVKYSDFPLASSTALPRACPARRAS